MSCSLALVLPAEAQQDSDFVLAPGYGKLAYALPEVASYRLPVLGRALDGVILDEYGQSKSLYEAFQGKYVLLSFIYSNCSDINGCPLTSNVNYKLKTAMQKDALLANNLHLISLSFDPARDNPEVMRLYGENFKYAGKKGEWSFLTTASMKELGPILQAYNQDIQREKSVNGDQSENISHILRVFLIDPEYNIRNIYSVGFLHTDLIINDVKTLLLNAQNNTLATQNGSMLVNYLAKPGDNKEGYATENYTTQSNALTERERKGRPADLVSIAHNPPLGLPPLPAQLLSSLSKEKIELGRKLFFDRRLSLNDTFSCAMCHVPEQGFSSNEVSMAVGIEGRSVRRNSPTIYNIAYATRLFHDGRENSLEQQAWGPLLANNEMGNPSIGYVIEKIKQIDGYTALFEKAFKQKGVNMLTVGAALAAYQRTLISGDSLFDRWYYAKQSNALSASAVKGFNLFTGKAKCVACHSIGEKSALFTDNNMHNTGIGYHNSMGIKPAKQRVVLAPGVFIDVDRDVIDSVGEKSPADLGLYEITENPFDRWKYKTPTLRNISLTAPYMHNGSLGSLKEVVQFYNRGGVKNEVLDPLIQPLNLSDKEEDDLVEFLQSLTGSNVDTLVADAFSVPVGDLTRSDPNWANAAGFGNAR
ncbi:MAG: SCO family protein [Gammaproteobacteria bacterium]|nr:SCO family protein [Gammaproteobacteria bacterium]MBL7000173.1 SCO family protein [Gammaproteobacteria bacterium]